MGKIVVLAVGPVVKREIGPALEAAAAAIASTIFDVAIPHMEKISTRLVAESLRAASEHTRRLLARALDERDILISDGFVRWPEEPHGEAWEH